MFVPGNRQITQKAKGMLLAEISEVTYMLQGTIHQLQFNDFSTSCHQRTEVIQHETGSSQTQLDNEKGFCIIFLYHFPKYMLNLFK